MDGVFGRDRPGMDGMSDRKGEVSLVSMELSQEFTSKAAPNPARCRLHH